MMIPPAGSPEGAIPDDWADLERAREQARDLRRWCRSLREEAARVRQAIAMQREWMAKCRQTLKRQRREMATR